eukprot:scaffold3461_cov18-Prasinocladus_malaysianus.AAC.3
MHLFQKNLRTYYHIICGDTPKIGFDGPVEVISPFNHLQKWLLKGKRRFDNFMKWREAVHLPSNVRHYEAIEATHSHTKPAARLLEAMS